MMNMKAHGFLSPNAPSSIDDVLALCPSIDEAQRLAYLIPYAAFGAQLNALAVKVVQAPHTVGSQPSDSMPDALLCRVLQDYEATLLLAARGMRAQSRTMARTTLESAFHAVAACRSVLIKVGSEEMSYGDALLAANERHRKNTAGEFSEFVNLADDVREQLKQLHTDLKETGDIKLTTLVNQLGLGSLYTVLYRTLSQDSHPSITSLNHHVETGTGALTRFKVEPDYVQYSDTITAASAAMLITLDEYLTRYPEIHERVEYQRLLTAYTALSNTPELNRD